MDVGERIALWRKARGLTQQQLAKEVGVTPAAIYQWEGTGESKTSPSVANLEAVVEALGLTMERFFGRIPGAKAS